MTESDTEKIKIIFEEYKLAVQTQMHFNDMIMKMRSSAISVFLAIISAAALSLQYNITLKFGSYIFHASILIALMGIVLMLSIYIIDYYYYNKMLIGSVNKTITMDTQFKEYKILNSQFLGQSTLIRDAIGQSGASKTYIQFFYIVPILIGIVFIILLLTGYAPIQKTS